MCLTPTKLDIFKYVSSTLQLTGTGKLQLLPAKTFYSTPLKSRAIVVNEIKCSFIFFGSIFVFRFLHQGIPNFSFFNIICDTFSFCEATSDM